MKLAGVWIALLFVALAVTPCDAQEKKTKPEKDPIVFPVEMAEYTLSVVDEDGQPIEGVEVTARGVRCEEDPGSWYGWPIKNAGNDNRRFSDKQGKATFRYPVKYGTPPDLQTLNKIDFYFSHAEFVASDQEADPRDGAMKHEMAAGCSVLFSALDPSGDPIDSLWVQMAGPGRLAKWILSDQKIRTSSIPDGAWQTMLVAPQKDGRTLFSGILPTRFRKNSSVTIRGVKLKPGIQLSGRIDDAVPRPVANGRVVAFHLPKPRGRCRDKKDPSLSWSEVTDIKEDGTFRFESLPRTGVVQLITVCTGWIGKSKPRDGKPARGFFILGELFDLDKMEADGQIPELVIPMEKAGSVEITVTKPDGKPLAGAKVHTYPNQLLNKSGSQLLGACYPSLDMIETLIAGKEWDWTTVSRNTSSRYSVETGDDGKCTLPDIPIDRNLSLHLEHEKFQIKPGGFLLTEDEPAKSIQVDVEPIPSS